MRPLAAKAPAVDGAWAAQARELIESLQKKVRKGQVSGTGSPFMPTLHMLFFSTYYGKVMY